MVIFLRFSSGVFSIQNLHTSAEEEKKRTEVSAQVQYYVRLGCE